MVNYMEDVAKLLGVQIGEYFQIDGYDEPFVLINDGLHYAALGSMAEMTLTKLLSGKCSIKRKPWKPKTNEAYWSILPDGVTHVARWYNDFIDMNVYKLGNCYRTEKEARANSDKWIAFYKSDEVLEV